MTNFIPQDFYQLRIQQITRQLKQLKNKLFYLAWSRGLVFLGIAIALYWAFQTSGSYVAVALSFFLLGAFLFLVQMNYRMENRLFDLKNAQNLAQNELDALNNDFSAFHNGAEFIQTNHDYSYDMDVFGDKSLFQILNRCHTKSGRQKLAQYLKHFLLDEAEINRRQEASLELAKDEAWREEFQVLAMRKEHSSATVSSVKPDFVFNGSVLSNKFNSKAWKIAAFSLSAISVFLLMLVLSEQIPSIFYFYYILLILGILSTQLKYINLVHKNTENLHKTMQKYADMIAHIESKEYSSEYLKTLKQKLISEQKSASQNLKQFAGYLKMLDNRLNFLFAILSNALLMWDIHLVRKVETWLNIHGGDLDKWINVLAEFEYLNSLACFRFNHPAYTQPEFLESYSFQIKELGHPALGHDKCVTNNINIEPQTRTYIVTGANMAGKSTFLRTFGTNLILAQIGAVVFAASYQFKPLRLLTSIRISDSLTESESYFYAELKRLQYIVEQSTTLPPALIIIDEMLRGTNSGDKHKGSEGLLKRLTQTDNFCIMATHDVALGSLQDIFPEKLKNICFEAEIRNDELFFDYKLKEGISKNLNATFLMKKMNIIEH